MISHRGEQGERPAESRPHRGIVTVRAGWVELEGTRVGLFDVAAEFSALHWAFFDEVGVGAGRFLYLAGLRGAVAVAGHLGESLADRELLAAGLDYMTRKGYGRFSLEHGGANKGPLCVMVEDSFEAWAYLRRQSHSSAPVCHYIRGMLAGLWCMAVEPAGLPSPNVDCWEIECAASGATACRFLVGSSEALAATGRTNSSEKASPRWELESLNQRLRLSTDRLREIELRLDERQQAYQHLLDNMLDPLIVVNHQGKISFCNLRFLETTGLTREKALGEDPLSLVHSADQAAVSQVLRDLLAGQRRAATFSFRFLRGEREFILECSARAMTNATGEPAVEAICRDVTERERARIDLESANKQLVTKQRIADNDLRLAKLVHESLLPERLSTESIDVDVKYVPVDRVGGDYCEVTTVDNRYVVLTVCDVSGHGVAAALLASRVNSHLREQKLLEPDPWAITLDMNQFLRKNFGDTGLFVTFLAVTIDLANFSVRVCGAGHPGPIIVRSKRREVFSLRSQHLPIGVLDEFQRSPHVQTIQLEPGDRLVLYTDGIIEAVDENGELLRTQGFERLLASAADVPIFALGDWLLDKVAGFRSGRPRDDITLMLAELKRPLPARTDEFLGTI